MKRLLLFILQGSLLMTALNVYSKESSGWFVVNDSVMGGVSSSQVSLDERRLVFSGYLSLENNGGFASTRTLFSLKGSPAFSSMRLTLMGDGKTYQLRFRTNRAFDGVAYTASFRTVKDQRIQVELQEKDFVATYRGYSVRNAPVFSFSDVEQVGFMIADKQQGAFSLIVEEMTFVE